MDSRILFNFGDYSKLAVQLCKFEFLGTLSYTLIVVIITYIAGKIIDLYYKIYIISISIIIITYYDTDFAIVSIIYRHYNTYNTYGNNQIISKLNYLTVVD